MAQADDEINGLAEVADQTRAVLYSADDFDKLVEVQLELDRVARTRNASLDQQREHLRMLTRQKDTMAAAAQAARDGTNSGGSGSQAKLIALDGQKLLLGKTIASLEQALSAAESQLSQIRDEAKAAERQDPYEDADIDIRVLYLSLYREFGFTPVLDDQGNFSKLLVQSHAREDVHAVPIGPGAKKTSANVLWQFAA